MSQVTSTGLATKHSTTIEFIKDCGVLMKFKLSLTVVFSAVMSFLIIAPTESNALDVFMLFLGGLLTSGAANTLNQVLEKDFDKLMKRTANRPVTSGRLSVSFAVFFAGILSLVGVSLLALFNPLTGFLGMVSLISYSFVYTPMKRMSNLSVFVGAIPGALPIIIGGTAANGGILTPALLSIFVLQLLWQLPHFWSIAWLADEDYKNAGFQLLPTKDGLKSDLVGLHSSVYALFLLPVSWMPYMLGETGVVSAIILSLAAIIFSYFGYMLKKNCDNISARKLMFASLLYLPVVLLALYFDKV